MIQLSYMLDYLTLKPEVFGMDISDLSLKIIKLKKKRDFLELASFREAEINSGIIEQGEIKDENALSEIIKKALSQAKGEKIKTKYVIASLPEEKAFLQVIQMPLMREEEMEKAVYFESENYIPLPLSAVYLDAQIVRPISNHLDHIDVLIAAAPKKIVDSYLSSILKSGLKPLAFEIESQAIARALVLGEKSVEPLLLIDLGALRASFIIFSGTSLRFTTSLPIAAQKFSEGKADFKNLADQIKKYMDYYQTHPSHAHLPKDTREIKKIILCGGGANHEGLCSFLSRELKLQVALGNPWSNILPSPLKEAPELQYSESLRYTTALGLALRGVKYHD